jgi:DNA-binding transcriptional regulator GbsR (MarR family)
MDAVFKIHSKDAFDSFRSLFATFQKEIQIQREIYKNAEQKQKEEIERRARLNERMNRYVTINCIT